MNEKFGAESIEHPPVHLDQEPTREIGADGIVRKKGDQVVAHILEEALLAQKDARKALEHVMGNDQTNATLAKELGINAKLDATNEKITIITTDATTRINEIVRTQPSEESADVTV